MIAPVLSTKLHVPPPRPGLVRRPRLVERLDEGLRLKLILVAAPAGFGKSTLLGEWLEGLDLPVAWLSLDTQDSNLPGFMTYFVAALRSIGVADGSGVVEALGSTQPPSVESIVSALVNEIAAHEGDFVLVLDDFHLIESAAVDEALSFLLEHLPPQMHVAIATREDPHLQLARLRARGQMIELRAADLRFSTAEAAEFLDRIMGLGLTQADS